LKEEIVMPKIGNSKRKRRARIHYKELMEKSVSVILKWNNSSLEPHHPH
jgi:hypothetical protein